MKSWPSILTLLLLTSIKRSKTGDQESYDKVKFSASQSYHEKQSKLETRRTNLQMGISLLDNFLGSVKLYSSSSFPDIKVITI